MIFCISKKHTGVYEIRNLQSECDIYCEPLLLNYFLSHLWDDPMEVWNFSPELCDMLFDARYPLFHESFLPNHRSTVRIFLKKTFRSIQWFEKYTDFSSIYFHYREDSSFSKQKEHNKEIQEELRRELSSYLHYETKKPDKKNIESLFKLSSSLKYDETPETISSWLAYLLSGRTYLGRDPEELAWYDRRLQTTFYLEKVWYTLYEAFREWEEWKKR